MKEKEKESKEISATVTRYYDALTDEEIAEDRAWGEFAGAQFPTDECVYDRPDRSASAPIPKR
jgi:hypothetical protein